jgi:hypothetical protein
MKPEKKAMKRRIYGQMSKWRPPARQFTPAITGDKCGFGRANTFFIRHHLPPSASIWKLRADLAVS